MIEKKNLMRALRQKRRAASQCISCGKPSDTARCPECSEKHRTSNRLPPLLGKCQDCGETAGLRERFCPMCAPRHRAVHRRRYWTRVEAGKCPKCGRASPLRLRYDHRTLMHGTTYCHICKFVALLNRDIRRGDPGPKNSRGEPVLNFWTDLWDGESFLSPLLFDRLDGTNALFGTIGRPDGDYGEPFRITPEIREELLRALEARGIPRRARRPWTLEDSAILSQAGSLEGFKSLRCLAAALKILQDAESGKPLPRVKTGYE